MELKFLIFLFVILPYIICELVIPKKEPTIFVKQVHDLEQYYPGATIADEKLILIRDGFLGEGKTGFVYAGKFVKEDRSEVPVAIKFFPENSTISAGLDLSIYETLKAYENPEAEKYGIPNVYYHGEWTSYTLTAMTKLEYSLSDIQHQVKIEPLDWLILFKNFIIQWKYMQHFGIVHGFINADNLMFKSNQSFITDFNDCEVISDDETTFESTHKDWKCFILMVIEHYGIKKASIPSWLGYYDEFEKKITDKNLKAVIKMFGEEAYNVKNNPDYVAVGELINEKINQTCKDLKVSAVFTWLNLRPIM